MHDVVHLPNLRAIAHHALPNVIIGKVVPVVVFLVLVGTSGTAAALLGALGWSLAVAGHRIARKKRVPALIVLSTISLVARTIAALATGSLLVYFLQPTVGTALVGAALAGSVLWGRPLAERLIHDFCPLEPHTAGHPVIRHFFRRLTVVWAATSMVNFAITLWLLLSCSPTTFVLVKSFLGPATTGIAFAIGLVGLRRSTRRAGLRIAFGSRSALPRTPAGLAAAA